MKNTALKVSAAIFLFIAAMHILRLVYKIEITAAGLVVPQWISIPAAIVFFALSFWMFKSSR